MEQINTLPPWSGTALTMLRRIVPGTTPIHDDDAPDDGADIAELWAATLAQWQDQPPGVLLKPEVSTVTNRPVHLVEPDRALMIARIAQTFADARGIAAMADEGAVTLLQTATAEDATIVASLVRHAMFDESVMVSSGLIPEPREQTVHLTTLLRGEGTSGDSNFKAALARVEDFLLLTPAVIVVMTDVTGLPPRLRAALPRPVEIAPLDAEAVLFAIAATHGPIDRPALRAGLPPDRALSRLGRLEIAMAFRQASAADVVRKLQELCEPPPRGNLDALAGTGKLLDTAKRVVADLTAYCDGKVDWAEIPRGMLLVGPPGTGKTHAARVIAEAAGLPTVMATVGEWQACGHLGDMLRSMRATFDEARRLAPCVLIIDEIDSIGSRTEPSDRNRNYTRQVVNEMLAQLDGLVRLAGVMLIGASNHPEHIDPAVLRAGRLDLHVSVPLPGPDALEQILRAHLGADAPADLTVVSRAARGQTPAAIAGAVRQARSRARTEGRPLDTEALIRAFGDPERQHPALRWRIAVHEAGHAMIAHVLHLGEIATLSIRGDGGEAVMHRAPSLGRIEDYHDRIAHALGGRAAEIVVFGAPTGGSGGGAESDLAIATHLALGLERCVGLGRNGLVWEAVEGIAARPMTAGEHAAVSKRLDEQCARAVRLLTHNRAYLERLARRLAEMGHLVTAEIGEFLPEVEAGEAADERLMMSLVDPMHESLDKTG